MVGEQRKGCAVAAGGVGCEMSNRVRERQMMLVAFWSDDPSGS